MVVTEQSSTQRRPRTQCTAGLPFSRGSMRDQWLVAWKPVEHPGLGQHDGSGTHSKDPCAGVVLLGQPRAQGSVGSGSGPVQCRHDHQVRSQCGVHVHVGEGVGRHQSGAALEGDRPSVRGDD